MAPIAWLQHHSGVKFLETHTAHSAMSVVVQLDCLAFSAAPSQL